MLSTYFNVLGLLLLFLLFSSWLAYVMFEDTQQGKTTFYSYEDTLYHMFLLFTTTNNPAVWVPAYKESRWYAIFFAFYVLLGFYFVRNLILAVVYEGFKAQLAKEVSGTDAMRKRVLGKAFTLLDVYKKGSLEKDQCIRLFEELNKYRSLPKISRREFEFIFHELDDSGDFKIDLDEFNDLCYAIALRFEREAPPSWLDNYPAFYRSGPCEKLKAFVRSSTFGNIITVMLILNLVAVAIETRLDIENNSAHKIWQEVEFVFGWIYALEMVLKVFSYGFESYWMKGQNRFDFVITWIIVIGETATVALPGVHFLSNGEWMRYLLIARMLRLIRLLTNVRHCRVFVATFLTLIPTLMPYLGTIFCVLCIYCSLGLQIFGGVVNSGNPKLRETDLYNNDFLLFNFNDYPNGMVALYNMLVGPWPIWMKSYQKLVGNSWSLPYFISFFLTSALLLFNLVVAFVLEAFNTEMKVNATKKSEEEDKEGEGRKGCRSIGSKTRSHRVDKLLRRILSAKLNDCQV